MSEEEVETVEIAEYAVIMTVRKFFWHGFRLGVIFTLLLAGACRWMELV
jgi:hypothetical protein